MKHRLPVLSLALVAAFAAPATAAPGDDIGEAIEIVNLVTADFSRDVRTLQRGDNVRQNEKIEVGSDGRSELEFDDKTKIALGPGSELLLDTFVYDPEKTSGSIVLNFVKGTLRFVTGVADKPSYVIRTPSASITVRGTIFDLFKRLTGPMWLLLHEGGVRVCNDRGTCRDHDEPGKLLRISDDGDIGEPTKWAKLDGKDGVPFDDAFPFVADAPVIDPNPIFTKDVIILGNLPDGKPEVKEPPRDQTYDKPKKKKKKTTTHKRKKKATKKTKTRKKKRKSADNNKLLEGLAIGVGVGIGLGKFGGKKKKHNHGKYP